MNRLWAGVVSAVLLGSLLPSAQAAQAPADFGKPGTVLITQGLGGVVPNGLSRLGEISSDGSTVVFTSAASNLVASDTNRQTDVFVWSAATRQITRISENAAGGGGNGASSQPHLSADGRYVVFASKASNLAIRDQNRASDVFLVDRLTGKRQVVSHLHDRPARTAFGWARDPWIAADGGKVVFRASSKGLVRSARRRTGFFEFTPSSDKVHRVRSPWKTMRLRNWVASPDGRFVGLTRKTKDGVLLRVWDRAARTMAGRCIFEGATQVTGDLTSNGQVFVGRAWRGAPNSTLLFSGTCDTNALQPRVQVNGGLDATPDGSIVAYNYSPRAVSPVQDVSVVGSLGVIDTAFLTPPSTLWPPAAGRAPAVSIDASGQKVVYVSYSDSVIAATAVPHQAIYLWDRSAVGSKVKAAKKRRTHRKWVGPE